MITKYYRYAMKLVFPTISEAELKLFSTHLARVKAACLLHEVGKDGVYIKLRSWWLSDYFQTYPWNTYTICAQHTAALGGDNEDILRKLAFPNTTIPKDPVFSDGITETDTELDDEDWCVWLHKQKCINRVNFDNWMSRRHHPRDISWEENFTYWNHDMRILNDR